MTPEEKHHKQLKRVVRLSKLNAYSIAIIAGSFGLLCVVLLELSGIIVGAAVAATAIFEIRGHRMLQRGEPGARQWMAGSQVWLIVCVLIYCAWRLLAFDPEDPLAVLGDAEMLRTAASLAMMPPGMLEDLVTTVYTLTYRLVALLVFLFQGALGLYYWVRVGKLQSTQVPGA